MGLRDFQDLLIKKVLILAEYAGINYRTWESLKRVVRTWGFNKKKQLEFITDFSSWLNDGCSPSQACKSMIDSGAGIQGVQSEVSAATSIYNALSRGKSISEGMGDWFDPEVVMLFDVGQKAGSETLTRVVNEYIRHEENLIEAKSEFWRPIKQPLMYWVMTIGFMVMLGAFVLPQFSLILSAENTSFSMKVVTGFSNWIFSNLPYVFLSLVLLFIFVSNFIKTNVSVYRLKMDNYFPLNIYRNFAAMRTLKTLGIMVEVRYNVHKAAAELKAYSNSYMKYHLNHIVVKTQFGVDDLGAALDSGLLNRRLMFRLRNAADSPDQNTKKSAISIAADRSGDAAVRDLMGTRKFLSIFFWLAMSGTLILSVSSFMGVVSSLFSMQYR